MYQHVQMAHQTNEKSYECNICDEKFSTDLKLQYHLTRTHGNFRIHCKLCHMAFKSKRYLTKHYENIHLSKKHDLAMK